MSSATVDVSAPAEAVWALLSDLTRMGEWSPETTRVEWTGGSSGPSVGATFKGTNKIGARRWSTNGRITAADPPNLLEWEVTSVAGLKVATWRYVIESTGEFSCRITESTQDQRGSVMKVLGALATGVKDRSTHNTDNMRATLERIKAAAEPTS